MKLIDDYLANMRTNAIGRRLSGCKRVLDYGCGDGIFATRVDKGAEYVGLDIDPTVIANLSKKYPGNRYITPDGLSKFRDGYFDAVVMFAVFEHLSRPEETLKEIGRVLAPGGRLFLTTPTPKSELLLEAMAFLHVIKANWLDEHLAYYTKRGLSTMLEAGGLRVAEFRYFQLRQNQFIVAEKKA
ncbi:MAG: class I SAM-dependent methyltransferase [Candidatus Micrarchaeota archaeon]